MSTSPAGEGYRRSNDERARDREQLAAVLRERCYLQGEFRLASGEISPVYFDCKRATLDPVGLHLVSDLLLDLVDDLRDRGVQVDAVGGPSVGADPITAGMALRSAQRGRPLPAFLVRGARKDHGTGRRIENDIPDGASVLVVEDVVTSGGSVLRALETIEEEGLVVAAVACIVDREKSGADALMKHGFHALFTRSELEDELVTLPPPPAD